MRLNTIDGSLITTIIDEMNSDDECHEKKAEMFSNLFASANPEEREKLDKLLIILTGWSLESLMMID